MTRDKLERLRWGVTMEVENFCQRFAPEVYFWTLTFAENVQERSEVEVRYKALVDLVRSRGGAYYAVWERQKRGAWHLHLLTNVYFDWAVLQAFLVARGWGEQLFVVRVREREGSGYRRLGAYIAKYLTKELV